MNKPRSRDEQRAVFGGIVIVNKMSRSIIRSRFVSEGGARKSDDGRSAITEVGTIVRG